MSTAFSPASEGVVAKTEFHRICTSHKSTLVHTVDGRTAINTHWFSHAQTDRQTLTDALSHICSQAQIHKQHLTKLPLNQSQQHTHYSHYGPVLLWAQRSIDQRLLFYCSLSNCETGRIIKKNLFYWSLSPNNGGIHHHSSASWVLRKWKL